MAMVTLTLDTLKSLDFGAADVVFRKALERAVRDCLDRPSDERARKITMQLNLKPVLEIVGKTATCEGAKGTLQVRCKIPDWETRTLDFGVKENGSLYFSEESPDNHRQMTAFDADGEDDA